MDNSIVEILQYMRNTYSEDIFYNFSKAKNLLNDLCPRMTQERIQAKNFIELNGYFMLKYSGNAYPIVRNKLISTYMSTYRVDAQTATWIVDVFGTLLGHAAPETKATVDIIPNIPDRASILNVYKNQVKDRDIHTIAAPTKIPSSPSGGFRPIQPARVSQPNTVSYNHNLIAADYHTVAIRRDGTVVATGHNNAGQCNVGYWSDIVSVAAGSFFTVGLRSNGTVTAVGQNDYGQCDVSKWRDVIAISAGARHTLGLRRDGVVLATGENKYGECNVSGWRNITTIIAGNQCTYAIKKDKKVLARGYNKHGEYDLARLTDCIGIADANPHGAIALKSDGTVQKITRNMKGDFRKIKNIKSIVATPDCFVGLQADGRVRILAYYWESSGVECSTDDWYDIVYIAAGRYHIVGLRSDGTIAAAMLHTHDALNKGQCDVGDWAGLRSF